MVRPSNNEKNTILAPPLPQSLSLLTSPKYTHNCTPKSLLIIQINSPDYFIDLFSYSLRSNGPYCLDQTSSAIPLPHPRRTSTRKPRADTSTPRVEEKNVRRRRREESRTGGGGARSPGPAAAARGIDDRRRRQRSTTGGGASGRRPAAAVVERRGIRKGSTAGGASGRRPMPESGLGQAAIAEAEGRTDPLPSGAPSTAVSRRALRGRRLASAHDYVDQRPPTTARAGEGASRPVCSGRRRANALCGRRAALATGFQSKPKVLLPLSRPRLHPNANPGPSSSFPMQRRPERAAVAGAGKGSAASSSSSSQSLQID
ncbi:hypothetical protein PVAP13_4KG194481 [Panicum virgatum]|uniref:Uncharacterized protein n=1 Tax=Panicum virgatum TaxID=38727 RepID=A0A8T0TF72_PANVG|nr:hypothetical protein PVAP13_4KG194481 [Panicum virgatum]